MREISGRNRSLTRKNAAKRVKYRPKSSRNGENPGSFRQTQAPDATTFTGTVGDFHRFSAKLTEIGRSSLLDRAGSPKPSAVCRLNIPSLGIPFRFDHQNAKKRIEASEEADTRTGKTSIPCSCVRQNADLAARFPRSGERGYSFGTPSRLRHKTRTGSRKSWRSPGRPIQQLSLIHI